MSSAEAPPQVNPVQTLFQAGTGYIVSSAFYVAVKLKIADLLEKGPRTAADLAKAAEVNEDALYRVLRALSAVGIFEERSPRTFALNAAADLLRTTAQGSFHHMGLWICDPFHFRVYAELLHSVQTGEPAGDKVTGMPVFEYFTKDRELSEIFNNAMTMFSAFMVPAALKAYDFSGIDVLVDVAGGHGEVLMSILREYPQMRGVLGDLDHVIAGAVPRIEAAGLTDRMRTEAIDFFKAVPAGGDAYVLKHIIHDWNDERAALILGNVRSALAGKPNGKVILLEAVLRPGNEPDLGKLIDLEMLALPGGKERNEQEFEALFAQAGLELTRVVPTESPLSVVEARVKR